MKPYFWIAIMACVGSFAGALIGMAFPSTAPTGAYVGTAAGTVIGYAMYTSKRKKKD